MIPYLSRFLLIFLLSIPFVIPCTAQGRLQETIKNNDIERLRKLLETSPHLANTCLDSGGNCTKPIHLAVQLGLVETVETLIKYGAKINARVGDDEMSPLDLAANSGNVRLIQVLLANQAEVNTEGKIIRGPGYVPPLTYAVLNNHIGAMVLLLEGGAKVNVEISIESNSDPIRRTRSSENLGRGNSPMYLNLAKSIEAAEILIAYGIKIRKSDEWGKTHASAFADVPPSQISAFIGEFVGNKKQRPTPAEIKQRWQVATRTDKQSIPLQEAQTEIRRKRPRPPATSNDDVAATKAVTPEPFSSTALLEKPSHSTPDAASVSSVPVPNIESCALKMCLAYKANAYGNEQVAKDGFWAPLRGLGALVYGYKSMESALVDCFPEKSVAERNAIYLMIFGYFSGNETIKGLVEDPIKENFINAIKNQYPALNGPVQERAIELLYELHRKKCQQ